MAQIECAIDEWMTGTRMNVPFTIQEYRGTYKSHLKCLQDFDQATKQYGVLKGICTKLWEDGWYVCILSYLHRLTFQLVSILERPPILSSLRASCQRKLSKLRLENMRKDQQQKMNQTDRIG